MKPILHTSKAAKVMPYMTSFPAKASLAQKWFILECLAPLLTSLDHHPTPLPLQPMSRNPPHRPHTSFLLASRIKAIKTRAANPRSHRLPFISHMQALNHSKASCNVQRRACFKRGSSHKLHMERMTSRQERVCEASNIFDLQVSFTCLASAINLT